MTDQEKLTQRLAEHLDHAIASALADALAHDGRAASIMELLAELEEASFKVTRAAIEAMPELQRRSGLADAIRWLDLGIGLALSSGATATKYFKESPIVMGLIEPAGARGRVLELALELAEHDSNTALNFLRTSPELLAAIPARELEAWANIGLELTTCDYVLGIEFFRQSPAVAAVLPVDQVRPWIRFGMKLVTKNVLGKTDYFATLEFFRTSPSILKEIEGNAVRRLVVTLGDQLAEREPEAAIAFLAEAPTLLRRVASEDGAQRLLQYGLLIAERDPQAALAYVRRGPDIVSLLEDAGAAEAGPQGSSKSKFEEWFQGGMEVLEYSAEGARAYFALETNKALASVEEAMSGVPLRQVARSLKLFVQGLCGVNVAIKPLPDPEPEQARAAKGTARATVSEQGRTLAMPRILRRYPTREENVRLYMVMAAHEAGHLEFGTYGLDFASLDDLIGAVQARSASGGESGAHRGEGRRGDTQGGVRTLEDLFALYPQPALMRDLWMVLEDARVEHRLQEEYPGLAADLAALAKDAVTTRSLLHGMSVREMVVDALLLLTTAERERVPVPDPIKGLVEQVWEIAQGIFRPEAGADQAVRLADQIYRALEEMPHVSRGSSPEQSTESGQDQDEDQDQDQGMGPSASEAITGDYRPVTNWAYRGVMDPKMITRSDISGGESPDRKGDVIGGGLRGEEDLLTAAAPGASLSDREGEGSQGDASDTQADAAEDDPAPNAIPAEPVLCGDDRTARHEDRSSPDHSFQYDEWDGLIQDYRSGWCRVVEQQAAEGTRDFAATILSEHAAAVRLLRRYFEGMRPPGLRRVGAQLDGEDLDMDAIVRRRADQVAQADPTERIYIRRERKERDVAVAFLVDLSGSTSRRIESEGRRVIDVEKEGLVLLMEAIDALGDHYAIYGYSGRGRQQVDFVIIKDFDDSARGPALNRIGGMVPLHQNRDGAAIRHATRKLLTQAAKVRLLVLISDGKPLDEGYADEYSLEDTKVALREARTRGVEPFCITVDSGAGDYLKRMYGEVRYLIIDRIASLPERLPRIYRRLTA